MKTRLLAGAALILVSAPAAAADDLRVRVGLGAELRPEFIGSDDHEVGPLWDLDFAKGENNFPFEAPDDSFGIKLISSGRFAAGQYPVETQGVRRRRARRESVHDHRARWVRGILGKRFDPPARRPAEGSQRP